MLREKCIRYKDTIKKLIFLLMFGMIFTLSGCILSQTENGQADRKEKVSSVMRQFVIGSDEEAVYLASVSDIVVLGQQSVSANEAGGLTSEVSSVFEQVNQARTAVGQTELIWSDELAAAADIRAKEIQKVFSHTRPDGSEWWTVNSKIIYGENLAKGYQSADSVMQAWMDSSEHKDNILYSPFQSIGIAVYELDGKRYWVQEFGY